MADRMSRNLDIEMDELKDKERSGRWRQYQTKCYELETGIAGLEKVTIALQ